MGGSAPQRGQRTSVAVVVCVFVACAVLCRAEPASSSTPTSCLFDIESGKFADSLRQLSAGAVRAPVCDAGAWTRALRCLYGPACPLRAVLVHDGVEMCGVGSGSIPSTITLLKAPRGSGCDKTDFDGLRGDTVLLAAAAPGAPSCSFSTRADNAEAAGVGLILVVAEAVESLLDQLSAPAPTAGIPAMLVPRHYNRILLNAVAAASAPLHLIHDGGSASPGAPSSEVPLEVLPDARLAGKCTSCRNTITECPSWLVFSTPSTYAACVWGNALYPATPNVSMSLHSLHPSASAFFVYAGVPKKALQPCDVTFAGEAVRGKILVVQRDQRCLPLETAEAAAAAGAIAVVFLHRRYGDAGSPERFELAEGPSHGVRIPVYSMAELESDHFHASAATAPVILRKNSIVYRRVSVEVRRPAARRDAATSDWRPWESWAVLLLFSVPIGCLLLLGFLLWFCGGNGALQRALLWRRRSRRESKGWEEAHSPPQSPASRAFSAHSAPGSVASNPLESPRKYALDSPRSPPAFPMAAPPVFPVESLPVDPAPSDAVKAPSLKKSPKLSGVAVGEGSASDAYLSVEMPVCGTAAVSVCSTTCSDRVTTFTPLNSSLNTRTSANHSFGMLYADRRPSDSRSTVDIPRLSTFQTLGSAAETLAPLTPRSMEVAVAAACAAALSVCSACSNAPKSTVQIDNAPVAARPVVPPIAKPRRLNFAQLSGFTFESQHEDHPQRSRTVSIVVLSSGIAAFAMAVIAAASVGLLFNLCDDLLDKRRPEAQLQGTDSAVQRLVDLRQATDATLNVFFDDGLHTLSLDNLEAGVPGVTRSVWALSDAGEQRGTGNNETQQQQASCAVGEPGLCVARHVPVSVVTSIQIQGVHVTIPISMGLASGRAVQAGLQHFAALLRATADRVPGSVAAVFAQTGPSADPVVVAASDASDVSHVVAIVTRSNDLVVASRLRRGSEQHSLCVRALLLRFAGGGRVGEIGVLDAHRKMPAVSLNLTFASDNTALHTLLGTLQSLREAQGSPKKQRGPRTPQELGWLEDSVGRVTPSFGYAVLCDVPTRACTTGTVLRMGNTSVVFAQDALALKREATLAHSLSAGKRVTVTASDLESMDAWVGSHALSALDIASLSAVVSPAANTDWPHPREVTVEAVPGMRDALVHNVGVYTRLVDEESRIAESTALLDTVDGNAGGLFSQAGALREALVREKSAVLSALRGALCYAVNGSCLYTPPVAGNEFTISVRVKPEAGTRGDATVYADSEGSANVLLYADARLVVGGATFGCATRHADLPVGEWTSIVAAVSVRECSVYLNGHLHHSVVSNALHRYAHHTAAHAVGAGFVGQMSNFVVFEAAATATDALSLHRTGAFGTKHEVFPDMMYTSQYLKTASFVTDNVGAWRLAVAIPQTLPVDTVCPGADSAGRHDLVRIKLTAAAAIASLFLVLVAACVFLGSHFSRELLHIAETLSRTAWLDSGATPMFGFCSRVAELRLLIAAVASMASKYQTRIPAAPSLESTPSHREERAPRESKVTLRSLSVQSRADTNATPDTPDDISEVSSNTSSVRRRAVRPVGPAEEAENMLVRRGSSLAQTLVMPLRKRCCTYITANVVKWLAAWLRAEDDKLVWQASVVQCVTTALLTSKGVPEFAGDQFTCSFNAVKGHGFHRSAACSSMLTVIKNVKQDLGLKVSGAVCTGDATVGYTGPAQMRRFTIISSIVQWSADLERLARARGVLHPYVDSRCYEDVRAEFRVKVVEEIVYPKKGPEPVRIAELMGMSDANETGAAASTSWRRSEAEWMYELHDQRLSDPFADWEAFAHAVFVGDWAAAEENMELATAIDLEEPQHSYAYKHLTRSLQEKEYRPGTLQLTCV